MNKIYLSGMVFFSCFFVTVSNAQSKEDVVAIIQQDTQSITAMRVIIDDILKQLHTLILKIQNSPAMPEKIEAWGKAQKIAHWPENTGWAEFKKRLDEFIQKLTTAKEQELQGKSYKYLAHIIENSEVSDSLNQLQKKLDDSIPTIIIPKLGTKKTIAQIKKTAAQAKKTIQAVIADLIDILYTQTILEKLDEIFKTYEPTAEKIKKENEEAEERAGAAQAATGGSLYE